MFGSLDETFWKNRFKPRRGKSSQERRFTLFLVSSHGESRSVSFGARATKVALTITLIATAAFLLFVRSYNVNNNELDELRYMRNVAEAQRVQIRDLEEQYSTLNERLRQTELIEAQIREMLDREGVIPQSFSPTKDVASSPRTVRTASRDSGKVAHDMSAADMGRTLYALQVSADKLNSGTAAMEEKANGLHEKAAEIVARLRATPNLWPVYGDITSEYGWRRHPLTYQKEFHDGIDIAASSWAPIRAAADGVVTFSGYKYGYGWMIVVSHGYGYETLYAHCVRLEADAWQKVVRGDVIAYVGQSGSATGPHVHYEVRRWGTTTNPWDFLPDESLEVNYSVR